MTSSPQPVSAVVRALTLLECFGASPTMTFTDLVRSCGLSKSTTHRLVATLEQAGWLERTSNGEYRLSIKVFQLGQGAAAAVDLRRDARPLMIDLAERTADSVYLVVADGFRAVCIERVDASDAVRVSDLIVGGTQDLHVGAAPRALLAFDEARLLPGLLAHGLVRRTDDTLTDEAALRADLEQTRRRGYAVSRGDATAGIGALGAPVFDHSGAVVAALSVGGMLERVGPQRELELARMLMETAGRLSTLLGHRRATSGGGHDGWVTSVAAH